MPTRYELVLAGIAVAVVGVLKLEARWDAGKEVDLRIARKEHVAEQKKNRDLQAAKAETDRITADSIAGLLVEIDGYEARATQAASAGAETYAEIIDALPDTLFEVRHLVDRREEEHRSEVGALRHEDRANVLEESFGADLFRRVVLQQQKAHGGRPQMIELSVTKPDRFQRAASYSTGSGRVELAVREAGVKNVQERR